MHLFHNFFVMKLFSFSLKTLTLPRVGNKPIQGLCLLMLFFNGLLHFSSLLLSILPEIFYTFSAIYSLDIRNFV